MSMDAMRPGVIWPGASSPSMVGRRTSGRSRAAGVAGRSGSVAGIEVGEPPARECSAHSPKIGGDLQRNRSTFGRTNTGLEPPSSNHTSCSGYGSTPGFRESPLTSSPEMQVFLHIGAHKTGTSTIQAALSAGGDFLYPATGRDGRRGHYPLAWSVVGRYRRRYSVPPASIW